MINFIKNIFHHKKNNELINREDLNTNDDIRRLFDYSNLKNNAEIRNIIAVLHDDVNQKIILVKILLLNIKDSMLSNNKENDEIKIALEKAVSKLEDAFRAVRGIISRTRSEVVESMGLVAGLESLILNYQNTLSKPEILLSHNLQNNKIIDQETATQIFQIIQEALLNAIKHAKADTVQITIHCDHETCQCIISDDGRGMPVNNVAGDHDGIGLIGMRERIRSLGGCLKIEPGHPGTKVSFTIPLDE